MDAYINSPARELGWSLKIAGGGASPSIEKQLREMATSCDSVQLLMRRLQELEVEQSVDACAAVIAPYEEVRNSGTVLLALSRNRPVILPFSPLSTELAEEFGQEWVLSYRGDLTSDGLTSVLREVEDTADLRRGRQLSMTGRTWPELGLRTVECYVKALENIPAR